MQVNHAAHPHDLVPSPAAIPVTVAVAEDHPLYKHALEAVLERHPGLALAGIVDCGAAAVALVASRRPSVLLLDLDLPDMSGIAVIEAIAAMQTPTRVLVLSGDDSPTSVCAALAAGAAGYLVKDASHDAICRAVLATSRGEDVLPRRLQRVVTAELRRLSKPRSSPLTQREEDVLSLAANGRTTAEAARELHLAVPTVKSHLASVYRKLGVGDRTAAVAEAARRGLIDLSG
jgi:two-component system nitrate/nitrite response regulator NarL